MRHVVQNPAQDVVVGEFEERAATMVGPGQLGFQDGPRYRDLRAYEDEDLAEDEDHQIAGVVEVVEGPELTHGIACGEEHCAQRVQSDQFEGFVVAGEYVRHDMDTRHRGATY